MKTWIHSLYFYRKIFFKIYSIFTLYSKIIFAFSHPLILSALKPLSLTESILLYYITNINFSATNNLNSQRLYTKFSPSNLTQGLLICVIINYLNITTVVSTVLRSLTTAHKCMIPFSERLIWSDDFQIFGLNLPPLMQNPLWNQSESCTAIQAVLNCFSRFSFLHRKRLSDNETHTKHEDGGEKPHFTPTPELPLTVAIMNDHAIVSFCLCKVQKKTHTHTHWMLSFDSNDSSKEDRHRHWLLLETSIITMWESKCSYAL